MIVIPKHYLSESDGSSSFLLDAGKSRVGSFVVSKQCTAPSEIAESLDTLTLLPFANNNSNARDRVAAVSERAVE